MPCSHCNESGHNIRTCPIKHAERDLKRNSDQSKVWKKKFEKYKALSENINKLNKELHEHNKELAEINAKLHQANIGLEERAERLDERNERWAIQNVLSVTKFKLAMKTIQNNFIKGGPAEPEPEVFDCPVCMEKQKFGIQCDNKHKLCLNCSCMHLFTSNQSCPMCRDLYIKEDIRDIAKESGVRFLTNNNRYSLGLAPIVPPIQFDNDIRGQIFQMQQEPQQ